MSMPEEKSSLRPVRPSADVDDARQQNKTQERHGDGGPRGTTDVPSEQDVQEEEMEHQRYGEAQPQLVPTDVIETMITARGRKADSLGGA